MGFKGKRNGGRGVQRKRDGGVGGGGQSEERWGGGVVGAQKVSDIKEIKREKVDTKKEKLTLHKIIPFREVLN